MPIEKPLDPKIEEKLKDILLKKGIDATQFYEYSDFKTGDGNTGLIKKIVVSRGKENVESLHLLIKQQSANEEKKRNFRTHMLFERENYVFESYLPAIYNICNHSSELSVPKPFVITPKHYSLISIDDCYAIIVEDMTKKGFSMYPRRVMLNHQCCEQALEAISRFHACSFILKEKNPVEFHKFRTTLCEVLFNDNPIPGFDTLMNSSVEALVPLLSSCLEPDGKYIVKLKKFCDSIPFDTMRSRINDFAKGNDGIIIHADFWTNNLLFKFSESNIFQGLVEQVCLLDFQATKYGSPASDISSFIFACADVDSSESIQKLIDFYFSRLTHWIQVLGSDPTELYPRTLFEKHLKLFLINGFLTSAAYFAHMASDLTNVVDVHSSEGSKRNVFETFMNFEIRNTDLVREHQKIILCYLVDNDCI